VSEIKAGGTIELTNENFGEHVTTDGITVVDFWAEWCGPCRQFGPIFEEASTRHTDITFGKVDTEAQRELAAQANITSIPTLMVFREGVLLYNRPGALPGAALEELLGSVRALDMEAIRAEIASNNQNSEG
jgi:thioredoxin 1